MKMLKRFICFILTVFSTTIFASATHYIIDTDMGFDDWLAVIYLLKQPIPIDGITIDCAGETYCPQGAINAERLTDFAKRHVPIAYGADYSSQYAFPVFIRDYATAMNVPGFLNMPSYHDLSKNNAAVLIDHAILKAAAEHYKVVFISIGTAKNIADAWNLAVKTHQTQAFREGLQMIYKGGGAFGKINHHTITNQDIDGNIPIKHLVKSNNTVAEWNIYADAPAMKTILDANLPVTFIPNNASDDVKMNETSYRLIDKDAAPHSSQAFTASAMNTMIARHPGGWKNFHGNIDFWDTAATIAAVHPAIVTEQFQHVPITLCLTPGKNYAGLFVDTTSKQMVTVDYHLNKTLFYQKLLKCLQS